VENTAIRKASVFLMALGPSVAGTIMSKLPEQMVEDLAHSIASIGHVTLSEKNSVLSEFVANSGKISGLSFGGEETAKQILEAGFGNRRASSVLSRVTNYNEIKSFEHNSLPGAFRAWLRNITRNCLYKMWRDKKIQPQATGKSSFQQMLNELVDDTSELSQIWDREYENHVLNSLLAIIEPEFKQQTWLAFKRVAVDDMTATEVAEELGITKNAVFIAKSRVLSRLREVGQHLIDD